MRSAHCSGWPEARRPVDPASRVLRRQLAELLAAEGGRGAARARSMALDLVEQVSFVGVLRSVNAISGCGFVDCPETCVLFSRDLPVPASMCDGVPIGASIGFRIKLTRGQPSVYDVAWPADGGDDETEIGDAPEPQAQLDGLSGMAAVLAHKDEHAPPVWNEAALTWKYARERASGTGMDSLLAHTDGPGRSAVEWRPSTEANDRRGLAAVRAHKLDPETYPVPQMRQGTFLGWTSN